MEATHEPNHNILTAILLFVGFVSEITRQVVDHYDVAFKIMTLSVLALGVIVNLDKAVKVLWNYCMGIYQWIKKK